MKLPTIIKNLLAILELSAYAVFLSYLMFVDIEASPLFSWLNFFHDKFLHLVSFAVLSSLIYFVINPYHFVFGHKAQIAALLAIICSIILEYLQTFTVTRTFELADIVAGSIGACFVLGWRYFKV